MQWDEKRLSRLFQLGKQADEKSLPLFEGVLARSRTNRQAFRIRGFRPISALTVVLIMSAIAFLRTRSHPADSLADLQTTPPLLGWHSPTDFLLETPGHELGDSLPQVGRALPFMINSDQALLPSQGEKKGEKR